MSILAFVSNIASNIPLSSRLTMTLYRIMGNDDAVIMEYASQRGFNHWGIVFINYKEDVFRMPKSIPLMFSLVIDHSEEEMLYFDKFALSDRIKSLLEKQISENNISDVIVTQFKVIKSDSLMSLPLPPEALAMHPSVAGEMSEVSHNPVAALHRSGKGIGMPYDITGCENLPSGDSLDVIPEFITMDDGSIIRPSILNQTIDPNTADGYFKIVTKVTPNAQGVVTENFFQFEPSANLLPGYNETAPASDVEHPSTLYKADMITKMQEYVGKYWLAGTTVVDLFWRAVETPTE